MARSNCGVQIVLVWHRSDDGGAQSNIGKYMNLHRPISILGHLQYFGSMDFHCLGMRHSVVIRIHQNPRVTPPIQAALSFSQSPTL